MIEESMKLEDYLQKTSLNIHCSFCNDLIFENEFIFSKINKVLYHIDCFKKYGLILDDEYIKINTNYLFNNCLEHCNKFSFFCQQCQASVCSKCDIDYHNDKYHILLQINTIRKTQNKKEAFKAIISKQRALLKKIKEMNNTLIQSLENDIIIKEQILKDYENNDCNYQTIINFNNFELNNNEKYEKILDDIMKKYNDFKKNNKKIKSEEIFINTILSPLYYSMMINGNSKYNENIINLLNKKEININNEDNLNIGNPVNKFTNKKYNKNILESNSKKQDDKNNNKADNININNEDNENIDNVEKNEKEIIQNKEFKHMEIKNIMQEKKIFNMIILHNGNIAISSFGKVLIYDSNNLISSNEKKYLLQQINITDNKEEVSYVFEFPDKTLFCSSYGKIFHIKLIENDRKYNILGIIELDKGELPSKLISLGDTFLAVLSDLNGRSFIKLFIKGKESDKNKYINYYDYDNINNNKKQIIDYKNYNFEEQSEEIINNNFLLDTKDIQKDIEFYPYSEDNNLNIEQKILCSIYEIKKNNNENRIEYKFISTSNSTYGNNSEDKLVFYTVKKRINENIENIEWKRIKKINLSCSTQSDSICQLNKKFLCVGLQNHCRTGQINGFAIIDIDLKEIKKIIQTSPIDSLYYNFETKILYSAMDIAEKKRKNSYIIEINKVDEGIDDIYLNNIYQFQSGHNDIIVSLSELKTKINEKKYEENNNKEIILASSSLDTNLKLFKINI